MDCDYDYDPLSPSEAAYDARCWAAMRDIMDESLTLTPVEKHAKLQSLLGVLLRHNGSSGDDLEENDSYNIKESFHGGQEKVTVAIGAMDCALSPSEASDDARRRAAVQDITTDDSLTPVEKQARVQSFMAGFHQNEGSFCEEGVKKEEEKVEEGYSDSQKVDAASAAKKKRDAPTSPPNLSSASCEKLLQKAHAARKLASSRKSRAAVRDIMTDASLTPGEKQAKVQSFMAGIHRREGEEKVEEGCSGSQNIDAASAAKKKKKRDAPPPPMSTQGLSSTSYKERISRKVASDMESCEAAAAAFARGRRSRSGANEDADVDEFEERLKRKMSRGGTGAKSASTTSCAKIHPYSSNDVFDERLKRKMSREGYVAKPAAAAASPCAERASSSSNDNFDERLKRKMSGKGAASITSRAKVHPNRAPYSSNDVFEERLSLKAASGGKTSIDAATAFNAATDRWVEANTGGASVGSFTAQTMDKARDATSATAILRAEQLKIDQQHQAHETNCENDDDDDGGSDSEVKLKIRDGGNRRQGSGYDRQSWLAMRAPVCTISQSSEWEKGISSSDKKAKGEADMAEVGEDGLVSACLVEDDDVVEAELLEKQLTMKRAAFYGGIALAVLATIVGLSIGLTRGGDDEPVTSNGALPTPAPTYDHRPTLERIAEEGVLKCGVFNVIGFGKQNDTSGEPEGFSVDLCRAVAAAALGSDTYAIQTIYVGASDRWEALANQTVDVLISPDTHTMERDVHEPNTGLGFSFTVPYFYDGLRFGGIPHYVDCADKFNRGGNCSDLQICVIAGSTHYDALSNKIRLTPFEDSPGQISRALVETLCNVVAGEMWGINPKSIRDSGYHGPYKLGTEIFSKEPLAMVTREDDPNFSEFVNVVLQSLISAESDNVTKEDPSSYANFTFFSRQYENMLVAAISEVGNLGEVYNRHLRDIMPRTANNKINLGGSGLIYSHPLGKQNDGPSQEPNGTLDMIIERGWLRCGVSTRNMLSGLDEDYCRALAAGIFAGDGNAVEFIDVESDAGRFYALGAGLVDVLSGSSVRFEGGHGLLNRSHYTGKGFLFSQPYFYFPDSLMNSSTNYLALATRPDDMQWFGFVYWVVASTFFAEEDCIYQHNFFRMPTIEMFGPVFNWLFRDVIAQVGNYGEMYLRNVNESLFPRDGSRNQLNRDPDSPELPMGPQHFPMEGFDGTGYIRTK